MSISPKPELILKVRDTAGPALAMRAEEGFSGLADLLAQENLSAYPIVEAPADLGFTVVEEFAGEASELASFMYVEAPEGANYDKLVKKLSSLPEVEYAYVKPAVEPAQIYSGNNGDETAGQLGLADFQDVEAPATPNYITRQGYLYPAPGGIDAFAAHARKGGKGYGVKIVDVEGAWRFSHEDLKQNQGGVIWGAQLADLGWRNHGTAVLGEFGGDENAYGITGISPDAKVHGSSISQGTAKAIINAANYLKAGDIILLEVHRAGPRHNFQGRADQKGYIAIEWWPDDFAAIKYATSKGIIVVEAAGNGAENLDDPIYDVRPNGFPTSWVNPFKRKVDSGAVLVGAGAPPLGTHGRNHGPDRSRLDFSNYGSSVDAQGWGREVTTTGYGDLQSGGSEDLWYTDQFSGTSSASPIVVGALACLQGMLRAANRSLLTPASARNLLRATGSAQQDAPTRPKTQRIGNRPDLKQMANRLFPRIILNPDVIRRRIRLPEEGVEEQEQQQENGVNIQHTTPDGKLSLSISITINNYYQNGKE